MVTIRQSLVKSLTRLYPFYSGCGLIANHPMILKIAGVSNEIVWSNVSGGKLLAPLNDYVGRSAYYVGDLDRKISWICEQLVKPGDTVLDIGANIGIDTLLLSKLVGKHGSVHSFEPNPKLHQMLEDSIAHNQISNVCLYPIALGEEQDLLELRIPRINAGMGSLVRNYINRKDVEVFEVPVYPLSKIVTEKGIQSISMIKIDVEGFEYQVLRGGGEVLESIRPDAILFELNQIEGSVANQPVIKLLRDFGYKFFSIPKCIFRMHLNFYDPDISQLIGHDFLAVPEESYEKIAKLVKASK